MTNTLGSWLKEKCLEERLSLRQAGEKAGLSHSTIQSIIKGERVSYETVVKLAHGFSGDGNEGVALELQLLALAGYPTREPEISPSLAKVLDTARGFSESQMKVLNDFAVYLKEVARDARS